MTTLKTCTDAIEANLIRTKLESEGITCFLINENFTNLMPHFHNMLGSGVIIKVTDIDYPQAKKLLDEFWPDAKTPVCPHCGSENLQYGLGRKKAKAWLLILVSILSFIPFNNIKPHHICKTCGSEFTI